MTKRSFKRICFAVFVLLLMTGAHAQSFDPAPIRQCINRHRAFFDEKYRDRVSSFKEKDERFSAYERMVEEGCSADEWRRVVYSLLWTNTLLKRPEEIELLLAALNGQHKSIHDRAFDLLMWNVSNDMKARYARQIKEALRGIPSSLEAQWLIAKCTSDEREKARLLRSGFADDLTFRALCGDAEAEKEIVWLFREASSYEEMNRWVRPLAFIGSKRCAEALVDGLGSPAFKVRAHYYESIRHPILSNLGLIYEDKADLFHDVLVVTTSEELDELDQWVRQSFGHPAWSYANVFVVRDRGSDKSCTCEEKEVYTPFRVHASEFAGKPKDGDPWVVDLGGERCMEFVLIEPGTFKMGSNNFTTREMPVHEVTITQPFWMARTIVTRGQFISVMGVDPLKGYENAKDSFSAPVGRPLAYGFCEKLTELQTLAGNLPQGYEITLPSEAQWEHACRAGSQVDIQTNRNEYVWDYDAWPPRYPGIPLPVAQKKPNAWGLYDMPGRELEWCSDCYHWTYLGASTDGSVWGGGRLAKCIGVVRGGGSKPQPASRHREYHKTTCGFRPIIQPVRQSRWVPREYKEVE